MSVGVTVLGATGTIGANTLDVISRHPDRFHVFALTANRAVESMLAACLEHTPRFAAMADPQAAQKLLLALRNHDSGTEVLSGPEGLEFVAAAPQAGQVMAGIVGAAGLLPTLAAARAGKRVLLANKEALVMAGHLFMAQIQSSGAELIPIDSEHNAIFQCMPCGFKVGSRAPGLRRVLLTASGGPFRQTPLRELASVTPAMAVKHPNWVMGQKISVDSATMMNKGLELIEAAWLFAMSPAELEVLIHPQSVVHSLVEYADGSMLAQLGQPDMRTPIAQAMAFPDRIASGVEQLDLWRAGRLEFEQADMRRFPCLALCMDALALGGLAPTVLNAANEIAVTGFLEERMGYLDIVAVIEGTLERVAGERSLGEPPSSLTEVMDADATARRYAQEMIAARRST